MKKVILLFSFFIAAILLNSTASMAQTTQATDTNSVAAKSTQIVNLLNKQLGLSPSQTTQVQSLVNEVAPKFAKSNNAVANSGGGIKEKVAKEEQSKLGNDFSTGLSKVLTGAQSTKYAGIKDKVTTMLTQIK